MAANYSTEDGLEVTDTVCLVPEQPGRIKKSYSLEGLQ